MNNISTILVEKSVLDSELNKRIQSFYNIETNLINKTRSSIKAFLNHLNDDLKVLIEFPYVDKLYRDTYYNYFSSKTIEYSRDCIRLSIFKETFTETDLFNVELIQNNYLGFLIIRPTFPNVIGRNVINPIAFKQHDIHICNLNLNSTCNYLKLSSNGFPHSSQDQETMTCAETTLWSIVEYFGNKYNEYRPLLPSEIHTILSQFSFERQIPSNGLQASQISFALKKIGFGVRIYSRNVYASEFDSILKTYIESGIPIVGVVQNAQIGHALNIIGRTTYTLENYGLLDTEQLRGDLQIKDINKCKVDLVFVDDNYAPYRTADISNPTSYYSSADWGGCRISNIIVPLYPKIYMEAGEARKISKDLLRLLPVLKNRQIAIKTFLTSSRSYKNYLINLTDIDEILKKILLSLSMPKFIWITEIFDEKEFLNKKCEGLIILDATEPKEFHVIGAVFEDSFIKKNNKSGISAFRISNSLFTSYKDNLKYYGDN